VVRFSENLESVSIENGTLNLVISDDDMEEGACEGTIDTYSIDLESSNCTVNIEAVLGVNSLYEE